MCISIWPAPESLELGWVEPSGGGAATADPGRPWAAASGSRQVGLLGAVARGEWMGPSLRRGEAMAQHVDLPPWMWDPTTEGV